MHFRTHALLRPALDRIVPLLLSAPGRGYPWPVMNSRSLLATRTHPSSGAALLLGYRDLPAQLSKMHQHCDLRSVPAEHAYREQESNDS